MKEVIAAAMLVMMPASVAAQNEAVGAAARIITAADFAWRVGVIADDSMQGRNTPSPGLDKTAAWLASELQGLGLKGGAEDGGFIQRYPLSAAQLDLERSALAGGAVRLAFGDDLLPLSGGVSEGEAIGGLVLLSGSGSPSRAVRRAVDGHHVVLVLPPGAPGVDGATLRMLRELAGAGARSVMVTNGADDTRWAESTTDALRPSVGKGWDTVGRPGRVFSAFLEIRTVSLERLLAGRGVDLDALAARAREPMRADEVEGLQLTLIERIRDGGASAPNVIAILEGSDPELREEYVFFSGHMDHIGMGIPDENGDSIYNGADDDASGTTAVIEVARAMASLPTPPRRSTAFLLVSGEEKGLWGSEWFTEHPTVPLGQVVADLNTDMVGRNWPDTIVAIGKEHSDLGTTLERVNAAHPELNMTAIDDLWPDERFYFRSDHFNFARKGVPILFFFNGTHDDYHGLDDEPDRIDAEKAARIARLVFYLGLDVANRTERPEWDPESYKAIVEGGR